VKDFRHDVPSRRWPL